MYGCNNISGSKWQLVWYQWPATTCGNVPVHQVRRSVRDEWAWACRTATSHLPVQQRYRWTWPDGLPLHAYFYSRRSAEKNSYWPLIRPAKFKRTLCPTWSSGAKWLCFLKMARPHAIARAQVGIVEQNLSLCQMEFRETVTATNAKQAAMHLRGDATCAKRMHDTNAESVVVFLPQVFVNHL